MNILITETLKKLFEGQYLSFGNTNWQNSSKPELTQPTDPQTLKSNITYVGYTLDTLAAASVQQHILYLHVLDRQI